MNDDNKKTFDDILKKGVFFKVTFTFEQIQEFVRKIKARYGGIKNEDNFRSK